MATDQAQNRRADNLALGTSTGPATVRLCTVDCCWLSAGQHISPCWGPPRTPGSGPLLHCFSLLYAPVTAATAAVRALLWQRPAEQREGQDWRSYNSMQALLGSTPAASFAGILPQGTQHATACSAAPLEAGFVAGQGFPQAEG